MPLPPMTRPIRLARCAAACLALAAMAAQAVGEDAARRFADEVVRAGDAGGRAFAVVDKPAATVWVFDRGGRLVDNSPVLLGQARGDVAPADIGTRPLSRVRPHEKVTSAGRYVTEPGRNHRGEDIVWLDYDAALSMHRVRDVPGERRPERLQSSGTADKRISFGCINLPADFYDRVIDPLFGRATGVVYVLPETQPAVRLFRFLRGPSS